MFESGQEAFGPIIISDTIPTDTLKKLAVADERSIKLSFDEFTY